MPNSKLIREVGLADGFVIHAAASQKANPAYEPTSEAALEQQAASPISLLSKQACCAYPRISWRIFRQITWHLVQTLYTGTHSMHSDTSEQISGLPSATQKTGAPALPAPMLLKATHFMMCLPQQWHST